MCSLAEVRHVVQELQRTDGVKDPGDMVSALSFAYRFEVSLLWRHVV
jgi:hypothetical protein